MVEYIQDVPSTNSLMMALAREKRGAGERVPDLWAIRTDFQSRGRGAGSNRWHSSRGQNILTSICFVPDLAAADQFVFNLWFSVVTREFLARHIPDVQIKWPNDMYIHGRKIAGDLTEHAVLGGRIDFTVAGIGINVNEDRFPEEIPHPASLFTETGRRYDVGTLMDEYMEMLRKRRPQLRQECAAELHDEYMAHLFRRDEEYFYLACGEQIGGIIRDIDRYGRLILEHTADGSRHAYEYKQVGYCF